MASHLLGVLQPAVVFQVNGDASCSPGVTSDGGEKARRFGPLSYCSPALPRLRARPVTVCSKRIYALEQVARSGGLWPQCTRSGSARAGDALAFRAPCRLFHGVSVSDARFTKKHLIYICEFLFIA